jgi:hypothetical protein
MQSLHWHTWSHPVVNKIFHRVSRLHKAGKSVDFCWVPGPVSLLGNETANAWTKEVASHGD